MLLIESTTRIVLEVRNDGHHLGSARSRSDAARSDPPQLPPPAVLQAYADGPAEARRNVSPA
jgi:hypothetical protein